jgi:hypothetical protein
MADKAGKRLDNTNYINDAQPRMGYWFLLIFGIYENTVVTGSRYKRRKCDQVK